jgi:hypothetical protein
MTRTIRRLPSCSLFCVAVSPFPCKVPRVAVASLLTVRQVPSGAVCLESRRVSRFVPPRRVCRSQNVETGLRLWSGRTCASWPRCRLQNLFQSVSSDELDLTESGVIGFSIIPPSFCIRFGLQPFTRPRSPDPGHLHQPLGELGAKRL